MHKVLTHWKLLGGMDKHCQWLASSCGTSCLVRFDILLCTSSARFGIDRGRSVCPCLSHLLDCNTVSDCVIDNEIVILI